MGFSSWSPLPAGALATRPTGAITAASRSARNIWNRPCAIAMLSAIIVRNSDALNVTHMPDDVAASVWLTGRSTSRSSNPGAAGATTGRSVPPPDSWAVPSRTKNTSAGCVPAVASTCPLS